MRIIATSLVLVSLVLTGCGQDAGEAPPPAPAVGTAGPEAGTPEEPAGDDTEQVYAESFQELISVMSGVAETLDGISDVESARAAIPVLEAAAGRVRKVNQAAESVGEADPGLDARMAARYMPKMQEAGDAFGLAMKRIEGMPEVHAVLEPALEKLRESLQ